MCLRWERASNGWLEKVHHTSLFLRGWGWAQPRQEEDLPLSPFTDRGWRDVCTAGRKRRELIFFLWGLSDLRRWLSFPFPKGSDLRGMGPSAQLCPEEVEVEGGRPLATLEKAPTSVSSRAWGGGGSLGQEGGAPLLDI